MKKLAPLLLWLLLAAPAAAQYSDKSVQITEGSEEGRNIIIAAELIRRLGTPAKADNILQMLKEGRIYWDPTLAENGDTDNYGWTKDMTLNAELVHHTLPSNRGLPFDPERDFQELLRLARTLCHEKVHVHQWRIAHNFLTLVNLCKTHEYQAWTDTIDNISDWISAARAEYDAVPESDRAGRISALRRLVAVVKLKQNSTGELVNNEHFAWWDDGSFWKQSEQFYANLVKYYTDLLNALLNEQPLPPAPPEVGYLPNQPVPRLRQPQEGQLALRLAGHDRAAGNVFTISLANSSDFPAQVCFEAGDVLAPSDPTYQRMILGSTANCTVPPHGSGQLELDGFCLDPEKRPPPSAASDCSYAPVDTEPYRGVQEIVKIGNRLSMAGKYAQDIQTKEKYRTTIIERALWYSQTRTSDRPFDQAKLNKDLALQVEKIPPEKRPSSQETEKVAQRIWDDVDLTVKAADRAPHHPAR